MPDSSVVNNGFSTKGSSDPDKDNSYCGTPIGDSHINDGVKVRSDSPFDGEINSISLILNDSNVV